MSPRTHSTGSRTSPGEGWPHRPPSHRFATHRTYVVGDARRYHGGTQVGVAMTVSLQPRAPNPPRRTRTGHSPMPSENKRRVTSFSSGGQGTDRARVSDPPNASLTRSDRSEFELVSPPRAVGDSTFRGRILVPSCVVERTVLGVLAVGMAIVCSIAANEIVTAAYEPPPGGGGVHTTSDQGPPGRSRPIGWAFRFVGRLILIIGVIAFITGFRIQELR